MLDHVAVDAAAAVVEEFEGAGHFLPDGDGDDRGDDQLAVGVFEAGAAGGAEFLKSMPWTKRLSRFKSTKPVAVDPEDFADVFGAEGGHGGVMGGAFDDDLVGADAVHHVVDAVAALVQVAFDLECGEAVGDDADAPVRGRSAREPWSR